MSHRVAIVGLRNYPNPNCVYDNVRRLPNDCIVISGGVRGVDSWAVRAAHQPGLAAEVVKADWDRYGRRAGPIRNAEIVARCDRLIAFWDGLSCGTLNTVVQAVEARVSTTVLGPDGAEVALQQAIHIAEDAGVVERIRRAKARSA
ncbi:MAG: DUF2493 domain-containing protein [Hyphomonas sp.]|nr:DUF2493 domain-containing protein [Hyphomonas sp.]